MFLDFVTVFVSATIATIFGRQVTPVRVHVISTTAHSSLGARCGSFWLCCRVRPGLDRHSKRLNLYNPKRIGSFLHEQRLTVEVCFTSGLLLTGTLYMLHAEDISRRIVMLTLFLVTVSLCTRRFLYRTMMHRKFESGQETRNVLIVGTGPEAHALRHHLESIRNLGYTFKGFIESPGTSSRMISSSGDVVGNLDTLFQHARQQFVDEILFTMPCERRVVLEALEKAKMHGVDLRVVPDLYEGLAWDNPIEYIGQFPTIPLHGDTFLNLALSSNECWTFFLAAQFSSYSSRFFS